MSVVAVYSPIGGSGKTTVALAIADLAAKKGKKPLFLSLEALCSADALNPYQEPGIVALAEAAADESVNLELKMKGLMKQGVNDICYVEGFERLADHKAVSGEKSRTLSIRSRRVVCDILIIDLNSGIGSIEAAVMKISDTIVVTENRGAVFHEDAAVFTTGNRQ